MHPINHVLFWFVAILVILCWLRDWALVIGSGIRTKHHDDAIANVLTAASLTFILWDLNII